MNTNNTKIIITALTVVLIITFLFLFNKISVDLAAPFVHLKLDGANKSNSSAGVQGEDLKTKKGNINAENKAGSGVEVKRAETETGDINLTNEAPSGGLPVPKP